ncbi:unnamed protein product, partial [Rotaria sp. Silwood2]
MQQQIAQLQQQITGTAQQ